MTMKKCGNCSNQERCINRPEWVAKNPCYGWELHRPKGNRQTVKPSDKPLFVLSDPPELSF